METIYLGKLMELSKVIARLLRMYFKVWREFRTKLVALKPLLYVKMHAAPVQ